MRGTQRSIFTKNQVRIKAILFYNKMAYAIESNQHSMVDRFGNFTHLVSGGNVQLPSEISRLDMRINLIDRPASGPLGTVQLSDGNGALTSEIGFLWDTGISRLNFPVGSTLFIPVSPTTIQDKDILFSDAGNIIGNKEFTINSSGESVLVIGAGVTSTAALLMTPSTPPTNPADGTIKFFGNDLWCFKGGWATLTGTAGAVVSGLDTYVQYNAGGAFGSDISFTFTSGSGILSVPNLLATTSLQLEETGGGVDVITIQAPASLTLPYSLTLPVDAGFSSQFLQTDGSGILTWATAVTTPAGANTEVQYNNGGNFAASSDFTWVVGTGILSVPNLLATTSLQLEETGGGVDVITIQAPASLTAYSLILPVDDGISGEFLQTDGSGILTWAATAAQVAGANTQIQYNDSGCFWSE